MVAPTGAGPKAGPKGTATDTVGHGPLVAVVTWSQLVVVVRADGERTYVLVARSADGDGGTSWPKVERCDKQNRRSS